MPSMIPSSSPLKVNQRLTTSFLEQLLSVASTVQYTNNLNPVFNREIKYQVPSEGKTALAFAKTILSGSNPRMICQLLKELIELSYQSVCCGRILCRNIGPDFQNIFFHLSRLYYSRLLFRLDDLSCTGFLKKGLDIPVGHISCIGMIKSNLELTA